MRKQTRNKTMLPTTKTDDWRFEFRYARNWEAFYTSLYSQSWLKSITASYKQLRQGQDMLTATETPLAVRIYVMFVIWKCYIVSDKPQDIFGESLFFLKPTFRQRRGETCHLRRKLLIDVSKFVMLGICLEAAYTSLYSQRWLKTITASCKQFIQGQDIINCNENPHRQFELCHACNLEVLHSEWQTARYPRRKSEVIRTYL